jgi:hypothetical protein
VAVIAHPSFLLVIFGPIAVQPVNRKLLENVDYRLQRLTKKLTLSERNNHFYELNQLKDRGLLKSIEPEKIQNILAALTVWVFTQLRRMFETAVWRADHWLLASRKKGRWMAHWSVRCS